jgi:uncharacterized membrane protein
MVCAVRLYLSDRYHFDMSYVMVMNFWTKQRHNFKWSRCVEVHNIQQQ